VLIVIDHCSKWCEASAIIDHDVKIVIRFLEDEVICGFGVPKYVLTNNFYWFVEFDQLCKFYGSGH